MNAMDIFQKIVTPGRLRLWTQGDELLTGFVARRADTAWAQTPSEIRDAHGYATSDPSFAGSPCAAAESRNAWASGLRERPSDTGSGPPAP